MSTEAVGSAPAVSQPLDNTALFRQLDAYDWDNDAEFQGGLRAILGSVQDPQQVSHLTLRAQCYYFARKVGAPIDFNGYKDWIEHHQGLNGTVEGPPSTPQSLTTPTTNGALNASSASSRDTPSDQDAQSSTEITALDGLAEPPRPASFAEICDMIAQGKPIPGIKDIPDTILEGQASESQASTRKKPWEKDAEADASPSWLSA